MDQEPKYMFRPIAEDATVAVTASGGPPASSASVEHGPSVLDHVVSTSGLASVRPPMTMSPNRPKLYSCWRRSEENWSSQGSRHSSRPGSSTASSSRPPSQPGVHGGPTSGPPGPPASGVPNSLYNKSNNSSSSDVSVARNFQQLTVSNRRALFKTQRWSQSFDQAALTAAQQAQMSPGKRRHFQAAQMNKSLDLDLDSGYSGSWSMTSSAITELPTPTSASISIQQPVAHQQARVSVCSPLESIKSELVDDPHSGWLGHPDVSGMQEVTPTADEEALAARSLLPSFPGSFKPEVNLIPASGDDSLDDLDEEIKMIVAKAENRDGFLSFLEEQAASGGVVDCDMFGGGAMGGMVGLGGVDLDEDLLYVRPEPVRTRNPLLCQKSSSSSGYDTCISSVSDTVSSEANRDHQGQPHQQGQQHELPPPQGQQQPLAPPRTKRGQTKMALANKRATENNSSSSSSAGKSFIISQVFANNDLGSLTCFKV